MDRAGCEWTGRTTNQEEDILRTVQRQDSTPHLGWVARRAPSAGDRPRRPRETGRRIPGRRPCRYGRPEHSAPHFAEPARDHDLPLLNQIAPQIFHVHPWQPADSREEGRCVGLRREHLESETLQPRANAPRRMKVTLELCLQSLLHDAPEADQQRIDDVRGQSRGVGVPRPPIRQQSPSRYPG